ncbi:hypothetical protein U1Q18_013136 [Sarracenia purpurea var. burkii]
MNLRTSEQNRHEQLPSRATFTAAGATSTAPQPRLTDHRASPETDELDLLFASSEIRLPRLPHPHLPLQRGKRDQPPHRLHRPGPIPENPSFSPRHIGEKPPPFLRQRLRPPPPPSPPPPPFPPSHSCRHPRRRFLLRRRG